MQIESRRPLLPILSCGLLAGALVSTQGCEEGSLLDDLARQCGITCPDVGVAEGNAAISGVVSIDSFFSAVVTVRDASANVASSMRAELEGIAASLEIDGYATMTFDELTTAVVSGLEAKFDANLQGDLMITFTPAKCEADIDLAVEAAAECDVDVDAGSIEARCQGWCEVSAEVAAECAAMGTLECTGTAPEFQCDGACQGSCQLEVAASCSGSCSGECDGACSSCVGGDCDMQGKTTMNCNGSCMGMCVGTCELEAAGTCEGRCEGSCTYMPAMGSCEAGATARCDVSGMADVQCSGKCEGTIEPPMVRAECQASVEARAQAEVVCTPPSLDVRYEFRPGLGLEDEIRFKAWLEGFKTRFAAMAAIRGKLDSVRLAAEGLINASVDVIPGVIDEIEAEGGLDFAVSIGLGCALIEADDVTGVLEASGKDLTGSFDAFAMVSGTIGGD